LTRDIPIAVRRLPAEDPSLTSAVELSAPKPLGDLGSLVFGNHPLDLDEKLALRVGRDTLIQKNDLTVSSPELIEQDRLMSETASQPVRRVDIDAADHSISGEVPKPIETGPVEVGARIAIIHQHEIVPQSVPITGHSRTHFGNLALDGCLLLLAMR